MKCITSTLFQTLSVSSMSTLDISIFVRGSIFNLGESIQTIFRVLSILWRIHPDNRVSDEEMTERRMILVRLMLDEVCEEYCGCKRPCKTFDFEQEDESIVELTDREHKQALLKQAKQGKEDMAYIDSDEKCNKAEYA